MSNSGYTATFSRRETPEVCVSLSLKQEGAGNAGCALHPRSRVQSCAKVAHTSIQGSGEHPTFPAQWLYGLSRAHPGVSGFLAPVASRNLALRPGRAFAPPQDLTPTTEASDPHDFAVRFGTARPHVLKTAHGVYPALQSFSAHDTAASTASRRRKRNFARRVNLSQPWCSGTVAEPGSLPGRSADAAPTDQLDDAGSHGGLV
jgi:hypothetical protein